jgi:hypothetical protein
MPGTTKWHRATNTLGNTTNHMLKTDASFFLVIVALAQKVMPFCSNRV